MKSKTGEPEEEVPGARHWIPASFEGQGKQDKDEEGLERREARRATAMEDGALPTSPLPTDQPCSQ